MRWLVILLAIATGLGTARAEKVKTNQETKVYARPGEQAKVIVKVHSGQAMTVIARDGRWIKVRVQGRTGYVPRSKVDLPDDEELVRNTRRRPFVDGRSTHRTTMGGDAPDDRIGVDATGDGEDDEGDKPKKASKGDDDDDKPKKASKGDDDDKPKKASKGDDDDKPKKASKGDDDKPKKASKGDDDEDDKPKKASKGDDDEDTSGGDDAKVTDDDSDSDDDKPDNRPTAHVSSKAKVLSERDPDSEAVFTAKPADVLYPTESKGKWTMVENEEGDAGWVLTDQLDMPDTGGGGGPKKRVIAMRGRLGVSLLSQRLTSSGGDMLPAVYNFGTSAASVALGGAYLQAYGKRGMIGGELAYDYAKTLGGIIFMQKNNNFALHNLNLRFLYGYDLQKKSGMMVFGRVGFRYQAFTVENYKDLTLNTLKLPQEVIKAPTIGVGLAMPRLTDKIGLAFNLDLIPLASITQTQGLEDGASPGMKGVAFGGVFDYKWKQQIGLQATYDLNYASVSFGAPAAGSMRGITGSNISRTDLHHTVTFGLAYGF